MALQFTVSEQDRIRILETHGIDVRRIEEVRAADHVSMMAPNRNDQSVLIGNLDGRMVVFFFTHENGIRHLVDARWSREGARFGWADIPSPTAEPHKESPDQGHDAPQEKRH